MDQSLNGIEGNIWVGYVSNGLRKYFRVGTKGPKVVNEKKVEDKKDVEVT